MTVRGRVVQVSRFGVLVELDPNLTALVHVSEMRDPPPELPSQLLSVGDEVSVRILRVDCGEHKIGASIKRAAW
jgi:ribosomal protein S1